MAGNLGAHGSSRRPAQPAARLQGEVVTPPATLTDEMTVRIPGFSRTKGLLRVRYWMPRGEDLPAAGDICLIEMVDREAWLVAWSPS